MGENEGGSAATSNAPAHVYSSRNDSADNTTNGSKSPVRNGPAPLHLLVDHRQCRCTRTAGNVCGCVPSVVRFERNGSTFVGVKSPPYGFGGSRLREFIGNGTKGRDAYQAELWASLRALAWKEHDRIELRRAVAMRERIARVEGGL
jgi:hypothetical protein